MWNVFDVSKSSFLLPNSLMSGRTVCPTPQSVTGKWNLTLSCTKVKLSLNRFTCLSKYGVCNANPFACLVNAWMCASMRMSPKFLNVRWTWTLHWYTPTPTPPKKAEEIDSKCWCCWSEGGFQSRSIIWRAALLLFIFQKYRHIIYQPTRFILSKCQPRERTMPWRPLSCVSRLSKLILLR